MALSVVLKGLPNDVPLNMLAYQLDKFLDTDEIGTFTVKEQSRKMSNSGQVILNFKSSYDAFTAQSILEGFKFIWEDGLEYVLGAKVSDDPSLQSKEWQAFVNEKQGHSSSKSPRANSCNNKEPVHTRPNSHISPESSESYGQPISHYKRSPDQPRCLKSRSPRSRYSRSPSRLRSQYSRSPGRSGSRYSRSPGRSRSQYSRSPVRPRSQYSRSPSRPRSPDYKSHGWQRSREYSESYRGLRSAEYYESHSPPRSHYSRSLKYYGCYRSSRDYDSYDYRSRYSTRREQNKERRYDDNNRSVSKESNTNTKCIDVTITLKVNKLNPSPKNTETIQCTETKVDTPRLNDTNVVIKKEIEFDNENTNKEFKLQMNIAIRGIMTSLQSVLDHITENSMPENDKKSIMKTLQSILSTRFRSLELDESMISEDIVHVYKTTFNGKDDFELITKLIQQLSDPMILIEDTDKPDPSDEENRIWSIIDEVLSDLKMEDFLEPDDNSQTEIIDKDGTVDKGVVINEAILENIKVKELDEDNIPNVQVETTKPCQDSEVLTAPKKKKKKKKCGPRKKMYETKSLNERIIPTRPKFHITVKNILKKLKPHVHKFKAGVNVFKIINVITYVVRQKITKLVEGKPYMKSSEIMALYRQRYPQDKDLVFVWQVIENYKKGLYSDAKIDKDSMVCEDKASENIGDEVSKDVIEGTSQEGC